MANSYYDNQRSKVKISIELEKRGWKIFGFREDQSDSMTDYWNPAHWNGLATKNGYVLVIDNDNTYYSGYEIKEHNYNKSAYTANDRIKKLTAMMNDPASTPNEKTSCATLIEKEEEKAGVKPTYTVKETYPTFNFGNPKKCSWHIEKDNQIIAKGTGVFATNSYDWEDKTKTSAEQKAEKLNAFINKIEAAIKQDTVLESEVIKVPKTVIKAVEVDTKVLTANQVNDNTYFIMKVGYTGGNSKGTMYKCERSSTIANSDTFVFAKLGKNLKPSKARGNTWYQSITDLNNKLSKGHIGIIEMQEFIEWESKTVYKNTTKKQKANFDNTAITGEVQEAPEVTEEVEIIEEVSEIENIVDYVVEHATMLITDELTGTYKHPETKEEKEIFTNNLEKYILSECFNIIDILNHMKVNYAGYKTVINALESIIINNAESLNNNIEEQKPMVNTMDVLKAYNAKIRSLSYNKQDVIDQYDFLINNKDKFYVDFMEYLNTSDKYKKKRKATKEEIVKTQYKAELEKLGYADKDIYTMGSEYLGFGKQQTEEELLQKKIDNMKKVIDKITDDSILLHIANKQAYRAELTKAVKEPETVEEFETKLRITGSLTESEQVKYEELKALKQVEANELKKVKTIEAIENAEFEIKESKHTKTGEQIFIVNMKVRVDRDKFNEINIKMKSLGAYYSNFPSNRGFIFKSDPTELLNSLQSGEDIEVKRERDAQAQAEKLEQLADNMQDTIDDKKADRQTNTARRERMAAGQYEQAEQMEYMQTILKTIAQAIAEGSTTFLKGINAKTHIETMEKLLRSVKRENDRVNGLSWDDSRKRSITESDILTLEYPKALAHRDHLRSVLKVTTNKKGYLNTSRKISKLTPLTKDDYLIDVTRYKDEIYSLAYASMQNEKYSSESIKDCFNDINRLQAMGIFTVEHLRSAMREYLQLRPTRNNEETREQKIKKLESKARFHSNIDGYFPTPKTIVQRMIDLADITDGETILEPSAGNGNILDGITAHLSHNSITAEVQGIEWNLSLREILQLKNYNMVGDDFLEYVKYNHYDKIIMNPPFEKNQDVNHVEHAYKCLKNGGRIVAIMSTHWTFANDSKSMAFREWLDGRGYYEKLPEGSFKDSGTGVNTVLVVIDKLEETAAEAI